MAGSSVLQAHLGRAGMCLQAFAVRQRRGNAAEPVGTCGGHLDDAGTLLEIVDASLAFAGCACPKSQCPVMKKSCKNSGSCCATTGTCPVKKSQQQ